MEERSITVGVSYSRKQSDGNYGTVEASEWESRDLPSDVSQEVVDAMKSKLRRTVEEKVEETISRKLAPQKPPEAPRQDSSSVKPQNCHHKKDGLCYMCAKAVREGGAIAVPVAPLPDASDGSPF